MSIKGKLFLVLLTAFLVTGNAGADPWPRYGISGVGDGPDNFLVSGAPYTLAGLESSRFYDAYAFDFAGSDSNYGYVAMTGGERWIGITMFENTLRWDLGFSFAVRDFNNGSFRTLGTDKDLYVFDGASIQEFVIVHPYGAESFIGYLLWGGPVVDDVMLTLIPDGFDRYVGYLDADYGGHLLFAVDVGELITSPVPEPSAYAMMLVGMLFLWSFRGRRVVKHDPGGAVA